MAHASRTLQSRREPHYPAGVYRCCCDRASSTVRSCRPWRTLSTRLCTNIGNSNGTGTRLSPRPPSAPLVSVVVWLVRRPSYAAPFSTAAATVAYAAAVAVDMEWMGWIATGAGVGTDSQSQGELSVCYMFTQRYLWAECAQGPAAQTV